ncbi:MAG TPA: response regulator transcription factor [Spirochaetia bacterium]|nr:response regulator transcription factor [Spirochaetia bacterium]
MNVFSDSQVSINGPDKVLIIEDDPDTADVVALNLQDLGLQADRAMNGTLGLKKALENDYALIVLDLMLPMMDGLSVCTRIREKDPYTPILMLSAKCKELDRVLGLEIGADEYVTKPFSIRELVSRVKALLRRVRTDRDTAARLAETGRIEIGELVMDFEKRKVTLVGRTIDLTVKEFDLLALFIRNPGRTYSRTDLLNRVWGYQFEGCEHTVNTHLNRLRAKIESDPGHPRYLRTVWGVGYRFSELAELAE